MSSELPRHAPVVLIVDDDRAIRAGARYALSRKGLVLLEAGRLSEARVLLASRAIDLLVVDGLLPDGTGIELVNELRAAGSSTRVVFVSAFFKDIATYRQLRGPLGVEQILHKPLSPDQLGHAVTTALAAGR